MEPGKPSLVTGQQLEFGFITIDVPHGDLLARAGANLGRWQEEINRLSAEMGKIQEEGIFLDDDDAPVMPGWWDRREKGHHIAWYLVWPAKYARRAGRRRRQYVKAGDYEVTQAKVARTLEYTNLKARRDKLARQIELAGRTLAKLAERYGW